MIGDLSHCPDRARVLDALSAPTPPADVAGAVKILNEQDREYNRKTNALIARHAEQVAALSARVAELEAALRLAKRLMDEALPKFNWGASALDGNAIQLLNAVPIAVNAALKGT